MKAFFCAFLAVLSFIVRAQSVPGLQKAEGERRHLLVKAAEVSVPASAAQRPSFQSKIWKAETAQNPAGAAAWLNLYLWTDRDRTLPAAEKAAALSEAVAGAEKFIGQSPEYFLLRYLHSNKKDSASLSKAFALSNDKRWLYPYMVQEAVLAQNGSALSHYATALNDAQPLSPALYEYHYNVLMSADSNAVVYAQGVNDLVPLAVLQQVHKVRNDVHLKYFDGTPVREQNAYLCLSLGKDVLGGYARASYTGLLVKAGGASVRSLKNNLEQRFDFRIAGSGRPLPQDVALLYRNYLPSLLLLYKYGRKNKDETAAAKWKAVLLKLAEQTGVKEAVSKQMEN